MEILVAKTAGFCFGVKRALELVRNALQNGDDPLYSLGPLIHNPRVVTELSVKGVQVVSSIGEIPVAVAGKIIICSHGTGPGIYQSAYGRNLKIIDATCPFVKNVHQLGSLLAEQGYQVIVFGEKTHTEVKGVMESIDNASPHYPTIVVSDIQDLNFPKLAPKVGIISQTTQETINFSRIVAGIVPYVKEIRVFNTICTATCERQQEAAELSRQVDLMIIVGGKNSANTFRLAEISRKNGATTYQVESPEEVQPDWFVDINRVGITAGASTPDEQIAEIIQKINYLGG